MQCIIFCCIVGFLLLQVRRAELQAWSEIVKEEVSSRSAFVWRVFVRLPQGTTLSPNKLLHHNEMNVFFVACDLFVKCCTNIVVGMAITSKPNGSFWAELLLCCDCCTASRKASYFPPGAWDHRSCGGSRTQSKQQVWTLRLTRIEPSAALLHHSKTTRTSLVQTRGYRGATGTPVCGRR